MTNPFFAATPTPASTEKPAERVAPIGDQPISAPVTAPADPAPVLNA